MRTIVTAFAFLMLGSAVVVAQTQARRGPFEGYWGLNKKECADKEGPNFNMSVKWPEVHRYERSCMVQSSSGEGTSTVVDVDCEFEGEKGSGLIKFTPVDRNTISVEFTEGASGMRQTEKRTYRRCVPH